MIPGGALATWDLECRSPQPRLVPNRASLFRPFIRQIYVTILPSFVVVIECFVEVVRVFANEVFVKGESSR